MSGGPILVFGLSEAASAVAHRLYRDGRAVVLVADAPPRVHRRRMSFADVWWDGSAELAAITCVRITAAQFLQNGGPTDVIPFLAIRPEAALDLRPWAVAVDARLAKRGAPLTLLGRAGLSIGCGPGHVAKETCDLAIETRWGDDLGAVIQHGPTAALAGEPRAINGVGRERIVYAPVAGTLTVLREIGDPVTAGDTVARVGEHPITAPITGTLRGMLRGGIAVKAGDKLCEVDPRPASLALLAGIGERPAAIAAGVAQAIGMTHLHLQRPLSPAGDTSGAADHPCIKTGDPTMTPDHATIRAGEDTADLPEARDAGLIFIGHVETPWTARSDCPKRGDPEGGPDCTLVLDPRWTAALKGVVPGDSIQVLYWMDRARRDLLTQSPRDDGATIGTFALRSPNRPNPIASSMARLIAISGNRLTVRGLDCVSGTPLLDLKPDACKGHA